MSAAVLEEYQFLEESEAPRKQGISGVWRKLSTRLPKVSGVLTGTSSPIVDGAPVRTRHNSVHDTPSQSHNKSSPPSENRGSSPSSPDSRPSNRTPLLGSDGKELPDLTARLKEKGLLKEYLKFRAGYNNWRQGKTRGAKGEFTHDGLEAEKARAEGLEPDAQEWVWRHTIIYWVCVFYLEGSLLFVVACIAGCVADMFPDMYFALTAQVFFIGAVCYSACNYLMMFEIMNLNTSDVQDLRWNPFAVSAHMQHSRDIGLNVMPFVSTFNAFVGASLFQISMSACLFPRFLENSTANLLLSQLPTAVGGTFFFISACCEVVEWTTEKNSNSVGAVVFFNVLGSILFTIAGWLYMVPPTAALDSFWIGNMMYLVGSAAYAVCALFDLNLWRNGNFGLGFSAQLAKIATGATHEQERLSSFNIVLVATLCFFAVLSATTCCIEAVAVRWSSPMEESSPRILYPAVVFVLIHMAIAYRSAVVKVPTGQPWRALHGAGHCVIIVACALVTAQIADCINEQQFRATPRNNRLVIG